MIGLKFTVSGEETIYQDINGEMQGIYKASGGALQDVGVQMIRNLQGHIYRDWYLQYDPIEYERRTDKPYYGTPLGSEKNMDVSVDGLSLLFSYHPTGEHKVREWSNHRWGDELIRTIQTNKRWTWLPHCDPRPFWDNFVEEQENSGIIESFIFGMQTRGYTVIPDGGKNDVAFGANESKIK